MFALRRTIPRFAANTVSRAKLSSVTALPKKPLPECYQTASFQKDFLSDPSCYPLIFILGFTSCWIFGMSANALLTYKDLRITTSHKHQVMQDWGDESHDSVTKRLANGPMIMHGQDFRSLQQEGLGINHEEWKKAKESHVH